LSVKFEQVPVDEALYALLLGTNLEVILSSSKDVIVIKKRRDLLDKMADFTVKGQVVSAEDGEALPGGTVLLQGTTRGTTTGVDGYYSITVPEDGVLVFSFVGYNSQTIPVNARTEINIELAASTIQL